MPTPSDRFLHLARHAEADADERALTDRGRYTADRPPAVLVLNDTRHLPDPLRWTGLAPELHV